MTADSYTPRLGIRKRLIFSVAGIIAAHRDYDPEWSIEREREVNREGYEVHLSAEMGHIDVWKQVTLRPDEFSQALRFIEAWEQQS